MDSHRLMPLTIGFLLGLTASGASAAAVATSASDSTKAPLHAGRISKTQEHVFETVLTAEGVQIYIYGQEGSPSMVEGALGSAVLTLPDSTSRTLSLLSELPAKTEPAIYFCPMHPPVVQRAPGTCDLCGGMKLYTQNRLASKSDLSRIRSGTVTALVTVRGLSGKEKEASFTVRNEISPSKSRAAAPAGGPAGSKKKAGS